MNEPKDSIRLAGESDEYETTSVVAVSPTWRDVWRIVRGRYRPMVVRRKRVTAAGYSRALKEVWSGKIEEEMYRGSPFARLDADSDTPDV